MAKKRKSKKQDDMLDLVGFAVKANVALGVANTAIGAIKK